MDSFLSNLGQTTATSGAIKTRSKLLQRTRNRGVDADGRRSDGFVSSSGERRSGKKDKDWEGNFCGPKIGFTAVNMGLPVPRSRLSWLQTDVGHCYKVRLPCDSRTEEIAGPH